MTDSNRSRRRFLAISIALLLPLTAGVLVHAARPDEKEPGGDALYKYLAIFSETLNLVRQNYVETTDPGTLLAGAMEGSTDALDAYSIFLPASVTAAEESSVVPGARHAGLLVLKDRGVAFAASVEKGSAAAAAGLEAGDIVSRVAGRPTRQMPLWAINHEMSDGLARATADPKTMLELEVVRAGETKTFHVAPAAATTAALAVDETSGFPLLTLPRLDAASTTTARGLLEGLEAHGKKKLIVDLRGLAGGEPEAAYAVAGLFAKGDLGALREKGKEQPVKSFASQGEPAWTGETVVLVDLYTAGPAEILAAVLQKSACAKLVGTPSFGWAGERSRLQLSNGARLLLTTAYWSAAGGEPISKSLTPDLLVDDTGRRFEDRDRPLSELILERAVRYLSGEEELVEKKAA
jgi:carboxyl-terminal processing protease